DRTAGIEFRRVPGHAAGHADELALVRDRLPEWVRQDEQGAIVSPPATAGPVDRDDPAFWSLDGESTAAVRDQGSLEQGRRAGRAAGTSNCQRAGEQQQGNGSRHLASDRTRA